MKISLLIAILLCSTLFACGSENDRRFLFFLHNRFLEEHNLDELHPKFGRTEYLEIISEFEKSGFKVMSEKRNGNVNAREYAMIVTKQIDSLIKNWIIWTKLTPSKARYPTAYFTCRSVGC